MGPGASEPAETSAIGIVATFARVCRYVAPFRGAFAVKLAFTMVPILTGLLLPWPVKVLLDHVIQGIPLAGAVQSYPFFIRPLLEPLVGATPTAILLYTVAAQIVMLFVVGAIGTASHEVDTIDANLASGQDMASRTENEANLGYSFAGGLMGLAEFRWTIRLTQALNQHYRARLFERIQALPITALDDQRIGDAVYRLMYDTPAITAAAYRLVMTPIASPMGIMVIAATIGLVFPGHQRLVWTALALLPLTLIATVPFAAAVRRRARSSRVAGAAATATVEEGLANVLAVQSLGGQGRQHQRFDADSWGSFTRHRALIRTVLITFFAAMVPAAILFGSGFLYVVDQVVDGHLTLGDCALLYTYFVGAALHALNLGALWISVQGSATGLERVFELMDHPGTEEPSGTATLPRVVSALRFEDVSFSYADGTSALHGVSFAVRTGEMIAVVGPTGAGKTTLVSMIPRFLAPQSGRVLIGEVDVATVNADALRARVAFVFQETALFDASVLDNLRFAKPDASESEVREAARLAGADSFVVQLPEGYDTRLGRGGGKLSVGQRQRLAIARALLRHAPILILDEPTSALDVDTERALLASLRTARRDRIVIIITHRLAAARAADMIVFLDHGRLIETGSHDALVQRPDGAYRRFVDLHARGMIATAAE